MIACLSPSDYNCEENLSTLSYAMKTNFIKNIPIKNKIVNSVLEDIEHKNKELLRELARVKHHIEASTATGTSSKERTTDESDFKSNSHLKNSILLEQYKNSK
jgi:hypothetical protein